MGATLCCSVWAYCGAFSCCRAQSLGTQAQQLWHMGLVAPQHVGSSRSRDRTHVPCIGRRILNHCTTREVLPLFFYMCPHSNLVRQEFSRDKKTKLNKLGKEIVSVGTQTRRSQVEKEWHKLKLNMYSTACIVRSTQAYNVDIVHSRYSTIYI